jgi:hypothetical protein
VPDEPLSTPLSHLLVAFTIEFDNEFERRHAESSMGQEFRVSMAMWSNFLRVVGDGISVGELPAAAGLPKARMLSTLGGMERWGYVFVDSDGNRRPPAARRHGFGSARSLQDTWVVRPTAVGETARKIWLPLFGEVEQRWEGRFGKATIRELRQVLVTLVGQFDIELPEYLPIVVGTTGMVAEVVPGEKRESRARGHAPHLPTLFAQALLAYTLDFERRSDLSLPLTADIVRVLDNAGIDVRALPAAAGVSKEGTSMAITFLAKHGYIALDPRTKLVRLTLKGRDAHESAAGVHAEVDEQWRSRYGAPTVQRLRTAMQGVLEQRAGNRPRLSLGLEPHPDGWRAAKRYIAQANAVLADPMGALPHYPMVLHRGGWPDGS